MDEGGLLTNALFIEKKSYVKGGINTIIQTYIEDEYFIHSAILCSISVLSFYPVIYFLNKQKNTKMGKRMFD